MQFLARSATTPLSAACSLRRRLPSRAVLLGGLGLFVLASCGSEPEVPAAQDGPSLYKMQQCATCHGSGDGGSLGPSLRELEKHWDVESLMGYLRDPKGTIAGDERLAAQGKLYMMPMPAVSLSDEHLRTLAEYVLGL